MKFPQALDEALTRVTEDDWRGKLDDLHGHYGTWDKTAHALGIHRRTLERWRKGYVSRGVRHTIKPGTALPKIRGLLGKDRRAAVAGVNWKAMRAKGTIRIAETYTRTENMSLGQYMSDEAAAGLAAAYVSRDRGRVQRSIDNYMSEGYMDGLGGVRITDVEWMEF